MAFRSSKPRIWAVALLLLLPSAAAAERSASAADGAVVAAAANLTQYVDPLIGTAAGGTFPGAAVPFGMVQLGPDTPDHRYYYPDDSIADFSTTHMSGAGCNNKGDVQFMPIVGQVGASPGTNWSSYHAPLSHDTESVAPGYYAVTLPNSQTRVELTATTRTGFTRLSYPSSTQSTILLNASRNNSFTDRGGQLSIVGDNQVTGRFNAGGTCSNPQIYDLFYVIQFDRPFNSFGTWLGGSVNRGSRTTNGNQSGGFVTFDTTGNRVVQMKVALSYVSLAAAQQAMSAESPGWSFDTVRGAADAAWNTALNTIQVSGGTIEDLKKFYTALYHVFYTPNVTSDRNGDYIGFDNARHNAGSRVIYQNYSGWDVYRSWIQLVSILAPQAPDIVQSMVTDGEQGVAMPMWSDANKELRVMVGDPSTIMVADAYAFGVRNFDTATALRLMDQSSSDPNRTNRSGVDDWNTLHYDVENAAVTLEYAAADFAISQYAAALGDTAKAQKYAQRGQYWKNSFNPGTRHMQGRRRDGSWMTPWSPTTGDGYVEGNGSVYTWMVPWNLRGLFDQIGGDQAVIPRLDTFFSNISGGSDKPYLDIGNEPSFSQPWIYNSVRQPWKTQDVLNRIVTERFHAAPSGYPGDDDLGSMSSWLVWAYLGMYPMIPGTDIMVLGTPRFPSATIHLANGQTVQINAPGASAAAHYTQALSVNGSSTQRTWLRYGDLARGATLDFQTGTSPNTSWGSRPGDEPPSFDVGTGPPPPPPNPPPPNPPPNPPPPPPAGNLALNRPATGSVPCVADEGPAKAVNGSVSGGNTDKFCSGAATKFLQVDLGSTASIGSFTLRHAGAGGESTSFNTRDFDIQVSANGTTFTTVAQVRGNTANVSTHTVTATGRYVRVNVINAEQTGTSGTTRIYELEVYGAGGPAPPPPSPSPGNLALNRPATGSVPCVADEGPAKAVNGSVSGGNTDKFCSGAATKFLQVDLGSTASIRSFTLRHAGAGGESTSFNTRDFDIQVSANGTTFTTVAQVRGNSANVSTHTVTASGRYVRVNVINAEQTGTGGTTRLYELEVYA